MNHNRIYFRRANKVTLWLNAGERNFREVASLDANLRKLGYALDDKLALRLMSVSVADIKEIHDDLIAEAKEIKGVRSYRAMYPNFPRQVMEADAAELYLNAIFHYFGAAVGLRIMPEYAELKRPELVFDESKVTLVSLGSWADYESLMVSLFQSKSAWSETDRADVASLNALDFAAFYRRASSDLPNRENKATIGAMALRHGLGLNHKIDTATDVLRLAVAMSDGDVSLAEKTKFRSFKRAERRIFMRMLAHVTGGIAEDMQRHAGAWKRLGERLHPGEFSQYPAVQEAFKVIRENGAFESFNAQVEAHFSKRYYHAAGLLLSERPGEFARRLDKMLRHGSDNDTVLDMFSKVAHKASPTVLLQARNAFVHRAGKDIRVFFPKGSVAKMQSVTDNRGGIRASSVQRAVDIFDKALAKTFAERGDLGGSWVDPALKGIAIPFGQRNASKALKTLGRGSRLSLDSNTGVIRFFIWWKDAEGDNYRSRTDIDLSAVCFSDKFAPHSEITYYNLRENGAVHSGDITSAPDGASEFIDIDVKKLRDRGVRYVAMTLHSYSGQKLSELPECFAGFMERADLDSGEIYDPRTVTNKADLTSNTLAATPFIFDLETGEAIWVDLSMQIRGGYHNVASTKGQITGVVEAMTTLTPPNLFDLFTAHAAARGGIVSKEKAKTIFSFDGDVTPFDTELILDKYL